MQEVKAAAVGAHSGGGRDGKRGGNAARRGGGGTRTLVRRAGWAAAGLYLLLLIFPEPAFPYRTTHGRFTVYSARPLPPGSLGPLLDRAERRLRASEIADPALTQRLFLCDGFARFAFFNPLQTQAVAANSYLGDNVFVVNADVEADRVLRDPVCQAACSGAGVVARTLSGTIAHETTHSLVRRRRGLVRSLLARGEAWKEEGYCDFVAQDGSFDPAAGRERLRRGETTGSPCYRYFVDREIVTYLLTARGLNFDRMMTTPLDEQGMARETARWVGGR